MIARDAANSELPRSVTTLLLFSFACSRASVSRRCSDLQPPLAPRPSTRSIRRTGGSGMPAPMLLVHGRTSSTQNSRSRATRPRHREKTNLPERSLGFPLAATQAAHAGRRFRYVATNGADSAHAFPALHAQTATRAFQGFSSADMMYLIMTDRFADGDPSNDPPARSAEPPTEEAADITAAISAESSNTWTTCRTSA